MTNLERFINDEPEPTSPPIKAALAHVPFETIHPFLDGNGRIGRLLIVLQLVADGVLREPSLYFKTHRSLYYELLSEVRAHGDWERWLEFFAEGIEVSATEAWATARTLLAMVSRDRQRACEWPEAFDAARHALGLNSALNAHHSGQSATLSTLFQYHTPKRMGTPLTRLTRCGRLAGGRVLRGERPGGR